MRLKQYRAASMAEAIARMRAELGEEALILGSRAVAGGVELTAAIDPEPPPAPAGRPGLHAIAAYHAIPDRLIRQMTRDPLPGMPADALPGRLRQAVRFAPIATHQGALLFAGPPGAGKTSTVARLATRLVLAGDKPLVITADGRRAGATEQLAAYTRLLGLNLVVATHPLTLARALTRREAQAPVLIDAAGTDGADAVQMQEIAALAATAAARIVLVLPAGLDTREAADIATGHAAAGASLMVATRLDLARRLGGVLAAAAAGDLALAEAGVGPGAADGLVPLTAAWLAERLLRHVPPDRPVPGVPPRSARIEPARGRT